MKHKYAVFDWDGTLADTYPVISAAYDYTFDKMGLLRIPYDEVKRITSTLQNKDTMGYIFKERRDEAAGYFYEYIEKYHTDRLAAMPGAAELLEYCRRAGMEIYLITNKKTRFIHEEIEKLGFGAYFKKVVAAGEYEQDKPHPTACHAVFDHCVPPAERIVVIGDGEADVKTAACYDDGDNKAAVVIYDPNHKYGGAQPTLKVDSLAAVIDFLEKND